MQDPTAKSTYWKTNRIPSPSGQTKREKIFAKQLSQQWPLIAAMGSAKLALIW